MIGPAIATTIIVASCIAVYIYRNHQKPTEYIWVGEGENPFKR